MRGLRGLVEVLFNHGMTRPRGARAASQVRPWLLHWLGAFVGAFLIALLRERGLEDALAIAGIAAALYFVIGLAGPYVQARLVFSASLMNRRRLTEEDVWSSWSGMTLPWTILTIVIANWLR